MMSDPLPEPVVCMAGCAQRNITPPVGVSLAGYFHDRVGKRVRDDLYARAMVVEHEGTRVALVSCDLVCITDEMSEATKAIIQAEAGLPPEHVLLCATHTHTGPEIRQNAVVPRDEEWFAGLPRLMADSVRAATDSMFRATVRAGRAHVEGYSHNRLFRLKDGSELFGKRGRDDGIVKAAGPIDPELQTLSLVDEEGNLRALAVNFALHPDVIGGGTADFISADWPGEIGRSIAAVYGKDVVTLFLQGTCGDINHVAHDPTHLSRGGEDRAVKTGRALAGAAMLAAERAEPMAHLPLWAHMETLSIPYYTREPKLFAEIEALKARDPKDLHDMQKFLIERTESWPYDGKSADVPLQVMQIGDVALVALPAEIFVRIGLEIKHFSAAPFTFVVELANARVSTYVATTDQAERGAYGAKPILSRWLCADAGRRMADAAQVALSNRFKGNA